MKQTVLDLNAFFCKPTKKIIRRHKRIIGNSPKEKFKNMKKRQNSRAEKRGKMLVVHNHNVQEREEYLQSNSVIDQQSKNASACLEAFGPAPIRPGPPYSELNSKDEDSTVDDYSFLNDDESSISTGNSTGCKLSP